MTTQTTHLSFEAMHAALKASAEGRAYRISAATEHGLLARFNAALLEACASARLECLDLAARIPHDSAYYYDEGHFNDAGAARVGEAIASWLLAPTSSP